MLQPPPDLPVPGQSPSLVESPGWSLEIPWSQTEDLTPKLSSFCAGSMFGTAALSTDMQTFAWLLISASGSWCCYNQLPQSLTHREQKFIV